MANSYITMNKNPFSYRHADDDIFDKETPFNEMEMFFIKTAFNKLDEYAQSNWQGPKIKPHAQALIRNLRNAIQDNLFKPKKNVTVSLFTRYFMENGFKDYELFASLAAYLTQVIEGRKRIISEDNFQRRLSMFELVLPDKPDLL